MDIDIWFYFVVYLFFICFYVIFKFQCNLCEKRKGKEKKGWKSQKDGKRNEERRKIQRNRERKEMRIDIFECMLTLNYFVIFDTLGNIGVGL